MPARYRLRVDNEIVGFKKEIGNQWYYSKDEYAWSGKEIKATILDTCFHLKDVNAKFLYAEDILKCTQEAEEFHVQLMYDTVLDQFFALDLNTEEIRNDLFTDEGFQFTVKRISYSFIQPS